ncbi:MAG: DUF5808 domain-containing protein [Thermoplasmatales archaeon]|nr:DUF5808 domain-containing protein [Thermoplasmatales archaeon]MCW6169796.1 DUF5808 domain-containing protein [Thermoplasmatales archaeon]
MYINYEFLLNFSLLVFLMIFGLIIPKLTLKTIQFGVRIPSSKIDDSRISKIRNGYTVDVLLYSAPVIVIFVILFDRPLIATGIVILEIGVYFVAYLKAHYKLLKIEQEEEWYANVNQVSYATISDYISPVHVVLMFTPMLFITIIGTLIGMEIYHTLPHIMAIHFGAHGKPNGFAVKTYLSVLILPIIGYVIASMFLSIGYLMTRSKIDIESYAPKDSYRTQIMFRNRTIELLAFIGILSELLILSISLLTWGIISMNPGFIIIIIAWPVMILLVVLIFSLRYGQMGSRKLEAMRTGEEATKSLETNIDDNKEWRAGAIYDNKHDHSIFVPKRFGVGYTINFGNKKGVLVFILLMSLPLVVLIITLMLLR